MIYRVVRARPFISHVPRISLGIFVEAKVGGARVHLAASYFVFWTKSIRCANFVYRQKASLPVGWLSVDYDNIEDILL